MIQYTHNYQLNNVVHGMDHAEWVIALMRLNRRYVQHVLATLVLIFGVSLVIINQSVIYNQLNNWKLLPQAEKLTELYFTDHLSLPKQYTPGETFILPFTVHNLEHKTQEYTYAIKQIDSTSNTSNQLATGSFTIDNDQFYRASIPITYVKSGAKSSIIVSLTNINQAILYHIDEK